VLRSFDFLQVADALMSGAWVVGTVWRLVTKRARFAAARVLIARPLWWLAARLLSVPNASARYADFSARALAKWEDFLLGR
jgi:hypothetical protein